MKLTVEQTSSRSAPFSTISGRCAFEGQSRASIIAKIIGAEPPGLTSLRRLTPPPVDRIVKRCLAKHPAYRWQCAGDLRRDLELLGEQEEVARPTSSRSIMAIAILLGLVAAAEAAWLLHRSRPSVPGQTVRFTIDPPQNTFQERPLGVPRLAKFPLAWSSDGRFIAYREIGGATGADINILDLKNGTERRFLASQFAETDACFASSGRWIAFVSDESGRPEVYVTTFPEGSARWQISSGGGLQPRWRADQKELYYYSADGNIMAVPIDTRSGFKAGVPHRLFACDLRTSRDDMHEYDVAPDGQRFLINTTAGRQPSLPLTVATGWRSP